MGDFLAKIRLAFVPLFGATIGGTAACSALNWFFLAHSGLLPFDDDIITLFGPMAIAFAIAMFMILTRFKRLSVTPRLSTLLFLLAWGAALAPMLITQLYVSTEAGGVSRVASADQIASAPFNRFYIARRICLDQNNILVRPVADVHGRYNEDLEFSVYVAVPVCGHAARLTEPSVWIGLVYRKTVSNRMSDSEKDAAYKAFLPEVDKQFNAEDPRHYRYLTRLGHEEERTAIEAAFRKAGRDPSHAIILVPHTDPFEQRSDGYLSAALISLLIGILIWTALLAWVPLKTDAEAAAQETQEKKEAEEAKAERLREGMTNNLLIPSRKFYGLPLLLGVNLLVFVAMVVSGLGFVSFETEDLVRWGANYGPLIHGTGVLRLISSQFVHAGIMHLANNMYGLLIVGAYLLPVAMNGRLIVCYLVAGLGASLTSQWIHPDVPSVGASGALFGLCGVLVVLLLLRDPRLSAARVPMLVNMAIFVGLNLVIGAATPGIDNAAHVGGLISGLVIGVVLYVRDRAWQLRAVDFDQEPDVTSS